MQRGDEHGALDRKLERALVQQIIEDRANPQPIPDPAKQQGSADPSGGDQQRAFVLVERGFRQGLPLQCLGQVPFQQIRGSPR